MIGVALSLTRIAWPFKVVEDLGRTGSWFHHQEMGPPETLPDGNRNDPAIPHRPIRGRG